ncbi:hypothetical protein SAMN05421819_4424 [Bryocella elongata]|uniref:DUF3352 domain-containing protein n=1 Tax=Bryocella elongata TaxID=863522 RepID=A0A1H6CCB0_9BACT|nr:hypothetical protein [Bryocella elongata]SEG70275.1 hypothetical protein SAMN05421819_4424 [Bryocella elongata]
MKTSRVIVAVGLATLAASAWIWAAQQRASASRGLAADLPPGALLTIESPDFSKLLADWNSSQEQAAWMRSASYNVFSNSRLWGRLTDAEQEFAGAAAGTEFGSPFLKSVAGTQSIFAWYDIGNLEFVYITHLKSGQSEGIELLANRSRFTARKAGDTTFYVRSGGLASSDSGSNGQQRTVAFAQRGEWLLIATREDLLANALVLMQGTTKAPSLVEEGWYDAAAKASPAQHGDLHMQLDLARIAHTPQFESYWIQRNISDTRRYRAAEIDLYREAGQFREERVLLPATGTNLSYDSEDTSALAELVPQDAGTFRASSNPTVEQAITELRDKVLERSAAQQTQSEYAPEAELEVAPSGDVTDLETRIDAIQPPKESPDTWLAPLQQALKAAPLTAMLSVSRSMAQPTSLFLPIHSAVVLRRSGPWDEATLSRAVLDGLRSRMTVGGVGVSWSKQAVEGGTMLVATGATPVALGISGNTAVVGTDAEIVRSIVALMPKSSGHHAAAATIAEFRPPQVRPAFMQLTSTLDRATGGSSRFAAASGTSSAQDGSAQDAGSQAAGEVASATSSADQPAGSSQPAFFHDTMGGLSRSFSSLNTERFLERRDGDRVHQTVLYMWVTPTSSVPAH